MIAPSSRWGYVKDGLLSIAVSLCFLGFAAFLYWAGANFAGVGGLPVSVQMRRPGSTALLRGLPPQVVQIAMLIFVAVALLGAVMFLWAGLGKFVELVRDWRQIGEFEATVRRSRARRRRAGVTARSAK
ncbi:MAG: hypothetical protein HY332_15565 [Chloroflexi bacterium]|nr:hypothetical protein [Chloroflexota bacterium]